MFVGPSTCNTAVVLASQVPTACCTLQNTASGLTSVVLFNYCTCLSPAAGHSRLSQDYYDLGLAECQSLLLHVM
jgi:hypothetical protein